MQTDTAIQQINAHENQLAARGLRPGKKFYQHFVVLWQAAAMRDLAALHTVKPDSEPDEFFEDYCAVEACKRRSRREARLAALAKN